MYVHRLTMQIYVQWGDRQLVPGRYLDRFLNLCKGLSRSMTTPLVLDTDTKLTTYTLHHQTFNAFLHSATSRRSLDIRAELQPEPD